MKNKYYFTIVLLLFCIFSLQAQNTSGKEFWVTFGKNADTPSTQPNLCLQIRIVSNHTPTTVTIYFTALKESVSFSMGAYEVYDYTLTANQKVAAYNMSMGVTDYSIHITSSDPVAVYTLNIFHGADATNIFPVTALGTEYYQISHPNLISLYNYSDAYAVVATQNNTIIYHDGIEEATLNAGQVYYRTDAPISDMTGAHITTNDKPVAFFALHPLAFIPFEVTTLGNDLMQQLAPVSTWGKTFFVPSSHFARDIVRIVASQNNTNIIQVVGGTLRVGAPGAQTSLLNLQAGQFVELAISETGCYIEANKPVGVCSYFTGFFETPFCDASQCWIPAMQQSIYRTQIAPVKHLVITPYYLIYPYALVCTPTHTKESTQVSVNGNSPTELTGGSWVENAGSDISFYTMPLDYDTSTYTFTNPKGMIILCYATGIFPETYYYLAGSAMRELDAAFYANDVHFQELKENPFCENEVEFRAEIENMGVDVDSIKWYINGIEYLPARDQLEWNKTFSVGEYEIKMWVRFENNDTISKTGNLILENCDVNAEFYVNNVHHEDLPNTTICTKDVVNFRAEIEGINPNPGSLKWYIDDAEEVSAQDQLQWSKELPTGTYNIKMWVLFENNQETTIESTLNVEVFWVKIKNIKY
jgi:hypothetical protein